MALDSYMYIIQCWPRCVYNVRPVLLTLLCITVFGSFSSLGALSLFVSFFAFFRIFQQIHFNIRFDLIQIRFFFPQFHDVAILFHTIHPTIAFGYLATLCISSVFSSGFHRCEL